MENNVFAERLNEIMNRKHFTSGMLSIKTGISERMIRKYRKGESYPSGYSLQQIAYGLGVSVDWLIGNDKQNGG